MIWPVLIHPHILLLPVHSWIQERASKQVRTCCYKKNTGDSGSIQFFAYLSHELMISNSKKIMSHNNFNIYSFVFKEKTKSKWRGVAPINLLEASWPEPVAILHTSNSG